MTDLQGAHIFELKELMDTTEKEQMMIFIDLGIQAFNDQCNLISLCTTCHKLYDDHILCVNPKTRKWVVDKERVTKTMRLGNEMNPMTANNKKFICYWKPPQALLEHRYQRFKDNDLDSRGMGAGRFLTLVCAVHLYFCCLAIGYCFTILFCFRK